MPAVSEIKMGFFVGLGVALALLAFGLVSGVAGRLVK